METTRQKKVARLIQKEIAEIILLSGSIYNPGGLTTVTNVRVSPDLSHARIYVSIFKAQNTDDVLKKINDATKEIRLKLGNKVRHQLRIVPNLDFYLDDSLDYYEKIDNLLK